jgi:aromatic-L-amino-acid/L-tryptophan decarboxylase
VHFVADPASLVKTLAIHPEYLKTQDAPNIINYSEWTIPLGRRFRALKLWFLLRAYGLEGLRGMIRNHVSWSENLAKRLAATADFRIVTPPMLSLFSFRHEPRGVSDLAAHNQNLITRINNDGRIYLTQTKLDGEFVIRFQAGAWDMTEADADMAYDVIVELAA